MSTGATSNLPSPGLVVPATGAQRMKRRHIGSVHEQVGITFSGSRSGTSHGHHTLPLLYDTEWSNQISMYRHLIWGSAPRRLFKACEIRFSVD